MKLLPFRTLLAAFIVVWSLGPAFGQVPAQGAPSRFEAQVRASDSVTLSAGQQTIKLWGVQKVEAQGAGFDLRARTALDNAIGQTKVVCETKARAGDLITAQCSGQDQDLGLFMIQQGFVTVDRAVVYGTLFEDSYIQAELQAQGRGAGIWGEQSSGGGKNNGDDSIFMVSFGFVLFLCVIAVFSVLSVIIMRGFQRVVTAQNQNVELMSRERKLRDKERGIVAIMLDAELKANKSKIEAYRVVYEEMLRSLKDPDRAPRYKKAGDIIQKQPALARSVFDRNTDKLDMLGGRLASEIIHYYARIKSSPEYVTLEPSTSTEDAVAILDAALKNARRLEELCEGLLESFANSGIVSEDFSE